MNQLFKNSENPTVLYSLFFNVPCTTKFNVDGQEGPIYNSSGPSFEVDYDLTLEQSENLFRKIYPSEEYLPKAPDPEEIVFGDDDGKDLDNINLGVLADIISDPVETGTIADENTGVEQGNIVEEEGGNIENATEVKETS